MSFSSLTPEFRESLRDLADKLAAEEQAKKEAAAAKDQKMIVKIAMEPDADIEIVEEGSPPKADNKDK